MKPIAKLREVEASSNTSYEMLPMRSPSRNISHDAKSKSPSHRASRKRWKPSKFPWRTFLAISSLPLALLPIVVLAALAEAASQSYLNGRACYPNGMWKDTTGATWRIMDSSYFFTPNLSFGAMTFTQVKVIDITWDLLVGRGGQMLLAWVNYRVFNEWLLYHMEMHRTSYKMYTSVAFQTTTLGTLGVLGKEWLAFGETSWRRFFRWLAMLCMLIGTLYVLAFPTLMAAMTGYITTYEPYVQDENRNLVAWSELREVQFIIQDSMRLGESYTKPLISVAFDGELSDAIANYSDHYLGVQYNPGTSTLNLPDVTTTVQKNVSSTFVFNGTTTHLPPPSLNITFEAALPEADRPSPGLIMPYYSLDPSTDASRQGFIFSASYLHTYGSCKPSETYQWGFSYIFLFMMSIFNFVWSCIMVGMWIDTRMNSRMYRTGRRPGFLRSVLDIATAMREEVGEDGPNGDVLSEKEIRTKLTESGGALVVPKGELRIARDRGVGHGDGDLRQRGWKRTLTKGSTF